LRPHRLSPVSTAPTPSSASSVGKGRWRAWAASRTVTTALAESVFATLGCELFDQQPGGLFATRREHHAAAKLAVFDYFETLRNPRRRQSTLGQLAPAAYEARNAATDSAA